MQRLFDSHGKHIANCMSGKLHSPAGRHIGRLVKDRNVFVDVHGKYLGEIIRDNRLLYRRNSPHRSMNIGSLGNAGSIGNFGNPGTIGSIGSVSGYEDIPKDRLA